MRGPLLLWALAFLISSGYCRTRPKYLYQCGTRECIDPEDVPSGKEQENARGYEYNGSNGYKLHIIPKDWHEARDTCQSEGGDLAVITDWTDYQILQNLYEKAPANITTGGKEVFAFVGLNDIDKEGAWYSIFGQRVEAIGWNHWDLIDGVQQPDNYGGQAGQNCGTLVKGGYLNDFWCDQALPFFCKKKINE